MSRTLEKVSQSRKRESQAHLIAHCAQQRLARVEPTVRIGHARPATIALLREPAPIASCCPRYPKRQTLLCPSAGPKPSNEYSKPSVFDGNIDGLLAVSIDDAIDITRSA